MKLGVDRQRSLKLRAEISRRFWIGPGDLLRDGVYRRLWTSVVASSFGSQIMILGLPLTAAVLLHASPTQMGLIGSMTTVPYVLFSLPSGVWLDRVRKLPVYITGELILACTAASVPIAWWAGTLSISWLYLVAFIVGLVNTTAGSASQIVLTQIVARERLVEANAKNTLASSGAEVAGPGVAGVLIKLLGGPLTFVFNTALLLLSAAILSGIRVDERPNRASGGFWSELKAGVRFVGSNHLLVTLACFVAGWEFCFNAVMAINILFATRVLGMSEQSVGLSYSCLGLGTVLASLFGNRISQHIGPGPCLMAGFGLGSSGFLLLAIAPLGTWGRIIFPADLFLYGFGTILIFVNFIALRQAVTPAPMLGRMTTTIRWLVMIPAGPGALVGGWIGQHAGLRSALMFAGGAGLILTLASWGNPVLRKLKRLPVIEILDGPLATPGR